MDLAREAWEDGGQEVALTTYHFHDGLADIYIELNEGRSRWKRDNGAWSAYLDGRAAFQEAGLPAAAKPSSIVLDLQTSIGELTLSRGLGAEGFEVFLDRVGGVTKGTYAEVVTWIDGLVLSPGEKDQVVAFLRDSPWPLPSLK